VLAYESELTAINLPSMQWITIGGSTLILLIAQLALITKQFFSDQLTLARLGLILLAMTAIVISLLVPTVQFGSITLPIFLMIFGEEAIGRWIFYASRLVDA
jgi:hypothetical protein